MTEKPPHLANEMPFACLAPGCDILSLEASKEMTTCSTDTHRLPGQANWRPVGIRLLL